LVFTPSVGHRNVTHKISKSIIPCDYSRVLPFYIHPHA
jgi:hypothetical protein